MVSKEYIVLLISLPADSHVNFSTTTATHFASIFNPIVNDVIR